MLPSKDSIYNHRGIPQIGEEECVLVSHIQLFATLWLVAYQAPLSIGFARQEY